MIYAFISYSRKDVSFAEKLSDDLRQNDIKVWRDEESLRGYHDWDSEIERVLCDPLLTHVIFVASSNSITSEMVRNEIEFARNQGKTIIVVQISEVNNFPLTVYRKHRINFVSSYKQAFANLLLSLKESSSTNSDPKSLVLPPKYEFKLTQEQIQAAQDTSRLIRLVAGPGTGKSLVIEERVRWLLERGIEPKLISVVSFTRAASRDLRERIVRYCSNKGFASSNDISVTTLHSLAMKVLRKSNKLSFYPSNPHVLDNWELKNIFDMEFSSTKRHSTPDLAGLTPKRAEEVRRAWEAYWNTGEWSPPNYIQPENPVTDAEKHVFDSFRNTATQVYSCVLPGEIVKLCVDFISKGLLDPVEKLGLQHLLVDEYQDLNYTDLQFINEFIAKGVYVYVAGDDDQSIYSFRYAYPQGIQDFVQKYQNVSSHNLRECFRCTSEILQSATQLINEFPTPNRIPKSIVSFGAKAHTSFKGLMFRWKFNDGYSEASAIANSCKSLIESGVNPRQILILVSKSSLIANPPTFKEEFAKLSIPVEISKDEGFTDTDYGRLSQSLIRIACDSDLEDYVAHRTILGLLKGIGSSTCNAVRDKSVKYNLNYMELFYNELPDKIFEKRERVALLKVREVIATVSQWLPEDCLIARKDQIAELIEANFGVDAANHWKRYINLLPGDMSLSELRAYMFADTIESQEGILRQVYTRLEIEIPLEGLLPQCVQVMTMHGAKGLNADIVFIPGLEDEIIPGAKRAPYVGLVQEGARLLYVSITRARVACFVTYAEKRIVQGKTWPDRVESRYCAHLGGRFDNRRVGLSDSERAQILSGIEEYKIALENRRNQI